MNSIAKEIDALRTMKMADLLDRYREAYGREPRVKHREHLWKRIAWKIQEQRIGGLSAVAKRRLEGLISELEFPLSEQKRTVTGTLKGPGGPPELVIGTVITRTYKGQEIQVNVVEGGFEWDGIVYRSLSAVAKSVTGSKWNGKLFFGLTKRKTNVKRQ